MLGESSCIYETIKPHCILYYILHNIVYSALSPIRYIIIKFALPVSRSSIYIYILFVYNTTISKALLAATGGFCRNDDEEENVIVNVGFSLGENAWVKCQNPFECVWVYIIWHIHTFDEIRTELLFWGSDRLEKNIVTIVRRLVILRLGSCTHRLLYRS